MHKTPCYIAMDRLWMYTNIFTIVNGFYGQRKVSKPNELGYTYNTILHTTAVVSLQPQLSEMGE